MSPATAITKWRQYVERLTSVLVEAEMPSAPESCHASLRLVCLLHWAMKAVTTGVVSCCAVCMCYSAVLFLFSSVSVRLVVCVCVDWLMQQVLFALCAAGGLQLLSVCCTTSGVLTASISSTVGTNTMGLQLTSARPLHCPQPFSCPAMSNVQLALPCGLSAQATTPCTLLNGTPIADQRGPFTVDVLVKLLFDCKGGGCRPRLKPASLPMCWRL